MDAGPASLHMPSRRGKSWQGPYVRTLWADVGIPGMRCHGSSLQEQGERRKEESLCIGG